ncbi:hypothetical protein LOD99_14890 [Oopsacas minuta]|uniref:Uncharacterized protein n=1 Tax=Oopsacas minuta TaxID=111878 RepID=A0AAV7KDG2_9METZ|nr:hypothetical protein LOD99_14890 [Oopsacas minuta]
MQTSMLFPDWRGNEINNNLVLNNNEFPYINANNTWIFTNQNDRISIEIPQNINTSIFMYNVDSILIQTSKKMGNEQCANLSVLDLKKIQIGYMQNNKLVTFKLPDMQYTLHSEDLVLNLPFNKFISSEIQVKMLNIPEGTNICIRFDFLGSITNASHIIGFETTTPTEGDLTNYQIEGKVCDKAYNICSGGISYIFSRDESLMEEMVKPAERLKWACEGESPCRINITIFLDYSVLIQSLTISGLTIKNRSLPKILLPWRRNCLTGESLFGGVYGMFQIYKESFQTGAKKISNIFSFDICLDPGDVADVYSIGIYDNFDTKILFREDINIQSSILTCAVITILFIKYYQQKKFILTLTRTTKWKSMTLPLVPDDSTFLESEFYDEISDRSPAINQTILPQVKAKKRGESNIDFTDNYLVYEGNSKKVVSSTLGEVETGTKNIGHQKPTASQSFKNDESIPRKETFYDYNNLQHF